MITVYGIPNCDVIKKATSWLQANKIAYTFHDYRKDGIETDKLRGWCKQTGYETIFNKRSTTWKELDPKIQAAVDSEAAAIRVMSEHTSIIKRPVIEKNGKVVAVGFDEKKYREIFK
ncbi:MAG: ArsC family reductase [Chitinophagaceae bacterium]|nr:ArsC family reductase [Chitinophagaceae bacterium]